MGIRQIGQDVPLAEPSESIPNPHEEPGGCVIPAPSPEGVLLGIRRGFRSASIPFLETRIPTDTLPQNLMKKLSLPEQEFLVQKRRWLKTPFPAQVAAIVQRVIEDRKDRPITHAICLGVGPGPIIQFILFSQIVAQLGIAFPGLLKNLTVQDPMMKPEMRAMFINHGCCRVVDNPAAFEPELLHTNTFLMSCFIGSGNLRRGLERSQTKELALFVGDGDEFLSGAEGSYTTSREELESIGPLFDEDLCNHEDVPTDRVRKRYLGGGSFTGLAGLDIWWKPVRSEAERLAIIFDKARIIGFPEGKRGFENVYDAGYSQLPKLMRERIIYSFIAARLDKDVRSFKDYYLGYMKAVEGVGFVDKLKLYEMGFRRWISIVKDDKQEQRTWQEYVEGKRWLVGQRKVLTPGWAFGRV
ncbi:hypothetical protein VTL71DRAFT_13335 [Oculimacula yallundae]|uniref:Uncharacterized protein n=1 Tax=Oculimacula yallundae TaxID=86028 RepID=A0ABR4CMC9_9HELO